MNSITIEKETTYIITTKDEDLTPIEPDQSSFNIRRVLIHINPQNQTINIYKGKTASNKSLNKARTIAREINAKHGFKYTIKQLNYSSAQNGWETYQKQKTIKPEPKPQPQEKLQSLSEPEPQSNLQTKENIPATILDTTNHPLPHSLAIMLASILNETLPTPFPQNPQDVKKILHALIDKLVEQNSLEN